MKKIIFTLTIAIFAGLVLTSCSKDVPPGSATKTFDLNFSDILVAAGGSGTTGTQTLELKTILPDDYKNVTSAELQYASSYIEITGLPSGASLKSLTIIANGKEYLLGDYYNDEKLSGNKELTYMSEIASMLATSKTVSVSLRFTNGGTVPITSGVEVKLHFTTTFRW